MLDGTETDAMIWLSERRACFLALAGISAQAQSFSDTVTYTLVSENPGSAETGDLDGGGERDIAVPTYAPGSPGYVEVLLNLGDGNFGAPTEYGVGNYPESVAAADLDGDDDSIHGDTIVVGAHGRDDLGASSGAVYTFERPGTVSDCDRDGGPDECQPDSDLDGRIDGCDCAPDNFYCTADCTDTDVDGFCVTSDCDDVSPDNWGTPGEVTGVRFDLGTTDEFSWDAPAEPGAAVPRYDILRSEIAGDFGEATCIESDDPSVEEVVASQDDVAVHVVHSRPGVHVARMKHGGLEDGVGSQSRRDKQALNDQISGHACGPNHDSESSQDLRQVEAETPTDD